MNDQKVLKKIKGYNIFNKSLGRGAFGKVYLAQHKDKPNNEPIAGKLISFK